MVPAPFPQNEFARIALLRSLNILDTAPEERFDQLTRIARRLFSVPIAQVTLVDSDRQWFKSGAQLPVTETPREFSFCAHAILGDEIMHVENALEDERFADNPLVTGDPEIRFYAGCPLRVGEHRLGTLCLIDSKPRSFSAEDEQVLRDLAEMAELNLTSESKAVTDSLTRLTNRRGFEALFAQAITLCARTERPAVLLYFDLNGFKQINDQHGHAEGDRALTLFAECLLGAFRESDVLSRLGGDEFAVLLVGAAAGGAESALERLKSLVGERNRKDNRGYEVRFSAGVVIFDPHRHRSPEEFLADADEAMYRNKVHGRNNPARP
jgi:diguanylate cyclase (GGDEF)-like protein